jgi:membrane-associated phospholipid phosphatase
MVMLVLCCQALNTCEQNLYETISQDWQSVPVKFCMEGIEIVSSPVLDVLPPMVLHLSDKRDEARAGFTGFVGDCAAVVSLKLLINRDRPDEEADRWNSSFPSGHTAFAFTQAVVYSHYNPKLKIPMFIYAAVVGFSRVYLGRHYPSDVLGGAAVGIAVGFLALRLCR